MFFVFLGACFGIPYAFFGILKGRNSKGFTAVIGEYDRHTVDRSDIGGGFFFASGISGKFETVMLFGERGVFWRPLAEGHRGDAIIDRQLPVILPIPQFLQTVYIIIIPPDQQGVHLLAGAVLVRCENQDRAGFAEGAALDDDLKEIADYQRRPAIAGHAYEIV